MRLSLNQQIFIGAFLGISGGIFLGGLPQGSSFYAGTLYVCEIVGGIFINLLKMIVIPLVFTSIASGMANLRTHTQIGRIWSTTLVYFLSTSALASLLGLIVVNIFKPGVGLSTSLFEGAMENFSTRHLTFADFLKSFLLSLFVNPVAAMAKGEVMATVVFAFFVGAGLIALGERTQKLHSLLNETFEIIMVIVGWVMRIAPWGVMALLTKLLATQDLSLLSSLAKFIFVVLGSTLFHGLVVLPLILYLLTGKSPFFLLNGIKEALITALSTSSSSATLPVTLRCVQDHLKVDKRIAGFVLPLGATINMDGTALYEAMAALFVANIVGADLNWVQQVVVLFMAVVASVGAPGIPSAGMVTMVMVLQAVGLPVEAIAILLPMDRLLDTFRTAVNVEGDCVGSLVVGHFHTDSGRFRPNSRSTF